MNDPFSAEHWSDPESHAYRLGYVDGREAIRDAMEKLAEELAATELNLYSDGPRVRRDIAKVIRDILGAQS